MCWLPEVELTMLMLVKTRSCALRKAKRLSDACVSVHRHTHTHMHTQTHLRVRTRVRSRLKARTHTHTDTHTHTEILTRNLLTYRWTYQHRASDDETRLASNLSTRIGQLNRNTAQLTTSMLMNMTVTATPS